MKRGSSMALISIAVSAAALVGWYVYAFPNYSYRYRLTVNIEIDGKVHSGSSVIDITWHHGVKIGDGSEFGPLLRGQAPIVDLDQHGIVVASLIANDNSNDGWSALWLVPRAFGDEHGVNLEMLPSLRGKRELAPNNLPRFLWFANPQVPTTGRKISVADIPSVVSPSARFMNASVEITDDPVVITIRDKLPWIKKIEDRPRGDQVLYLPNNIGIGRPTFVGGAS
jgi:hypothetical protein